MKVYLDIARGNIEHHVELSEHHQRLSEWLNAQHASYGLPPTVEELDEVQRETLQSLFEDANPGQTCVIDPPKSLVAGRLTFELSDQPNLIKHVENFRLLATGQCQLSHGKELNKKKLRYSGTPLHRFIPGFVLQGGDVTRKDGSGGESVYGSNLPDPKPPHATHSYGSLSMASGSSKNSSTSQFFISLCGPGTSLSPTDEKIAVDMAKKKLDGKYYPFGTLLEGEEVLRQLEKMEVIKDSPVERVWVENAGVV